MKFIFSILFFFTMSPSIAQTSKRDIIVISYSKSSIKAKETYQLLLEKFNFPKSMVRLYKQEHACLKKKAVAMQLCIDNKGILRLTKRDQEIVDNTLNQYIKLLGNNQGAQLL